MIEADFMVRAGINYTRSRFYRQIHDREQVLAGPDPTSPNRNYRGNSEGMARARAIESGKTIPEVYRLLPDHQTYLECRWIRMWREMNPTLSQEVFDTLLDENYMLMNHGTGYPSRYNCMTGSQGDDPDNGNKQPVFDAPRACGGMNYRQVSLTDGRLWIESLISSDPTPTAQSVLDRPWLWYWGTQVNPLGVPTYITRSMGTRVRIPLITRMPVFVYPSWVQRIDEPIEDALWRPI